MAIKSSHTRKKRDCKNIFGERERERVFLGFLGSRLCKQFIRNQCTQNCFQQLRVCSRSWSKKTNQRSTESLESRTLQVSLAVNLFSKWSMTCKDAHKVVMECLLHAIVMASCQHSLDPKQTDYFVVYLTCHFGLLTRFALC